jgi:hypothetical protein
MKWAATRSGKQQERSLDCVAGQGCPRDNEPCSLDVLSRRFGISRPSLWLAFGRKGALEGTRQTATHANGHHAQEGWETPNEPYLQSCTRGARGVSARSVGSPLEESGREERRWFGM